jgi:hypothetical protein
MPARVIIGDKGGQKGMWISVPGKSASSTAEEDLLVSTSRTNLNPVMAGIISKPVLSRKGGDSRASVRDDSNSGLVDSDGWLHYEKIYYHNLGYTPIAFFSVGSAYAGEHYPQIYINSSEIRLYHRFENLGRGKNETEFQYEIVRFDGWTPVYGYVSKGRVYFNSGIPSSLNYQCDIHYILYRQAIGV